MEAIHRGAETIPSLVRRRPDNPCNPTFEDWGPATTDNGGSLLRASLRRLQTIHQLSGCLIEIGCGNGFESSTHPLIGDGFHGVWCDSSHETIQELAIRCKGLVFGNLLIEELDLNQENSADFSRRALHFLGESSIDLLSLKPNETIRRALPDLLRRTSPALVCLRDSPTTTTVTAARTHQPLPGYEWIGSTRSGQISLFAASAFAHVFDGTDRKPRTTTPGETVAATDPGLTESNAPFKFPSQQRLLAHTPYGKLLTYADDHMIGRSVRNNGSFQEAEIIDVMRYLRTHHHTQPRAFLDIGANIGTHSILALQSKLFERAICFEVEADNFKLLMANAELNGLTDSMTCFHLGLSDKAGEAEVELSGDNFGDHRISAAPRPGILEVCGESLRARKTAHLTTLDQLDLTPLTGGRDILTWIDTQGHEGHVFAGGQQFFRQRGARFVVCEYWPYGLERSGGTHRLFEVLKQCHSIHDLGDPEWRNGRTTTWEAQQASYQRMLSGTSHDVHPHTNLLLDLHGPRP